MFHIFLIIFVMPYYTAWWQISVVTTTRHDKYCNIRHREGKLAEKSLREEGISYLPFCTLQFSKSIHFGLSRARRCRKDWNPSINSWSTLYGRGTRDWWPREGARELSGERREGGRFIIARGAQGNKRAQVTARRERSHVPGFENGPSRLPRVI